MAGCLPECSSRRFPKETGHLLTVRESSALSPRAEKVAKSFCGRRVRYRHYLAELSRKPQAVRQVAPELVAELVDPFTRLWRPWQSEQGAQGAARSLARLLHTLHAHGERRVRRALEQLDFEDGFDVLSL